MAVTVVTVDGEQSTYEVGESWHIDEVGRLHIRDSEKVHIAAFNGNAWMSVHEAE